MLFGQEFQFRLLKNVRAKRAKDSADAFGDTHVNAFGDTHINAFGVWRGATPDPKKNAFGA